MTWKGVVEPACRVSRRRGVGKRDHGDCKFFVNNSIAKTSSAIKSFFLAATLYPEVVRSAQQELDEVLGGERLPDFSDVPRLPYVMAIVKEVLRWKPPAPLGAYPRNVVSCAN